MKLREKDEVWISGAAGRVVGRVEAVLHPGALPLLEGIDAGTLEAVEATLREIGCTELALISHVHNARRVLFAALRRPEGWFDLKRQRLTIRHAWAKN